MAVVDEFATLAARVSDQLEITDRSGRRRTVSISQAPFVLGSGPEVDLRLDSQGIEDRHLRLVRTGTTMRVEPVRAGGTVAINGEELFCKDLRDGDVIALGNLQLRWIAGSPSLPPAALVPPGTGLGTPGKRGAKASERASKRTQRPSRSGGVPTVLPVTGLSLVVVLVGFLLYRHFAGSTWPSSPEHYVELARSQLANQEPQRALDTIAFALREASGETRKEALALEADIRRLQLEVAQMPMVIAARNEHDQLLEFAARNLRDRPERAAAREFVRQCDQWLSRHRQLCSENRDGKPLLATIEEQRARFVAIAALEEPDRPSDVIFAARSRLVFQWRDYRGAIERLDAYLAKNPDADQVRTERAAITTEAEEWLQKRLANIDYIIGRGDHERAEQDLAQLERKGLPHWASQLAQRRSRLPK